MRGTEESWGGLELLIAPRNVDLLSPRIFQPRDPVEHLLHSSHLVPPISRKVAKPFELEFLIRPRGGK